MLTDLNVRITFDKTPSISKWLYQCDCGAKVMITASSVRKGRTTQCRICSRKQQSQTLKKLNPKLIDGVRSVLHPLRQTWLNMWARCHDEKAQSYHYYGARGIKVCSRWESFTLFVQDMGEKPTSQHSIDRINNDGNYEPENCRWATTKQQMNNRRKIKN